LFTLLPKVDYYYLLTVVDLLEVNFCNSAK
jgi:hypothetical protein